MKTVCVLVCNNGLGHLKRVLYIVRALLHMDVDFRFNIFIDKDKLKYFDSLVNELKKFSHNIAFLDIKSDVFMYEEDVLALYKDFIDEADWVWSDNFAFVTNFHSHCILTGSFLWCDVYDRLEEEALLKQHKPYMIGSRYFATDKARSLTNFHDVDLYEYASVDIKSEMPKSILLTCGQSEAGRSWFSKSIDELKDRIQKIPRDWMIHIEPDYYSDFREFNNVVPAQFNEAMYPLIGAAVIRPGLGTINDALARGLRIFAFYEKENFEVSHNAGVLARHGVGNDACSVIDALDQAVHYLNDEDLQKKHFQKVKLLKFGGIQQTADKLCEVILSHGSEIKTADYR